MATVVAKRIIPPLPTVTRAIRTRTIPLISLVVNIALPPFGLFHSSKSSIPTIVRSYRLFQFFFIEIGPIAVRHIQFRIG